jgi:CubicO group peptidase (beta-lactamase class C family)
VTGPGASSLVGIADWVETWQVPNAAAAVVTKDGVVDTFGDLDRSFRLASVTKLMSAYAVLVALEEEALELDDPAGPPDATVRHLLAHTAGYGFESDAPVVARPATKRIYSNRGFEVLAAHLTSATEIEFADYLSEGVLEPLGMSSTELRGSAAFAGWGCVRDLTSFAAELLAPTLISRVNFDNAVDVQFPLLAGILPGLGRFDPLDWGLGFERNFGRPGHWAGTKISPSAFGHFGAAGTFLWVDPSAAIACVCLADRDFGDWSKQAWPSLTDAVLTAYAGFGRGA